MVGKEIEVKKDIIVSIFMLTYNQEEFIAQAIEGVLAQNTDFKYQLVIGEDCSTDGTPEICLNYAEKYPDKIKLLLNDKNIGLIANYVKTYKACTGKYVAICDGDDYWIDPLKLQKQVGFLEGNTEYKIIYTHNKNLLPTGELGEREKDAQNLTTSFKKLVLKNYIPSVTVLFKKEALPESMENWLSKYPFGDWPTYLFILRNGGKIYFLNEVTAIYRKDFGTSTVLRKNRSKMGEINLSILRDILRDSHFSHRSDLIQKSITNYKIGLMSSYNKEHKFFNSFSILIGFLYRGKLETLKIYLYSLKRTFSN